MKKKRGFIEKGDIKWFIIVIPIFLALGFFSEMFGVGDLVYFLVWLFFLVCILVTRKRYEKEYELRWMSFIMSFLLPGLGQAIYGKQWLKMIILLIVMVTGATLLPIIFALYPSAGLFLVVFIFGIAIYNLTDAYKIGKKAEEKR